MGCRFLSLLDLAYSLYERDRLDMIYDDNDNDNLSKFRKEKE